MTSIQIPCPAAKLGVLVSVLATASACLIPGTACAGDVGKDRAIANAVRAVGLAPGGNLEISAQIAALPDGRVSPRLGFTGKPVWSVVFKNVKLVVRAPAPGAEFQKPWHREED